MKANERGGAFNILWLQAGSCGGCTMSMLEHGSGGWFLRELGTLGVNLLWHPSVSEETGTEARVVLERVEAGEGNAASRALLRRRDSLRTRRNGFLQSSRRHGSRHARLGALSRRQGGLLRRHWLMCDLWGRSRAIPTHGRGGSAVSQGRGGRRARRRLSFAARPARHYVAGCAPHPGWIMETLAALALDVLTAGRSRRARTAEILCRSSRASWMQPQRIL